jgi:polygalacturonase
MATAAGAARLNVLDFGARGDGVTPDDRAIQAAIDAAQNITGTTPVVYFPGGLYLLEATLRVAPHAGSEAPLASRATLSFRQKATAMTARLR